MLLQIKDSGAQPSKKQDFYSPLQIEDLQEAPRNDSSLNEFPVARSEKAL